MAGPEYIEEIIHKQAELRVPVRSLRSISDGENEQ